MKITIQTISIIISMATVAITIATRDTCPYKVLYGCICIPGPLEVQCIGTELHHIPDDLPADILILTFRGNQFHIIDYVPSVYHTIISLELDQNEIRFLRDNAFQDLGNVEELYLENNDISGLHNTTFFGLSKVRLIELEYNSLYELNKSTFNGIITPMLESINIAFCRIYTMHPQAFDNLKQLRILNISNNNLNTLPAFESSYPRLEKLDLSHNNIGLYINKSVFHFMPQLSVLDLRNNRIQTMLKNSLAGLENSLQILYLQHNNLHYVEQETFSDLSMLRVLDLSFNQLQTLAIDPSYVMRMDSLLVHHNKWYCDCNVDWAHLDAVALWNDNQSLICNSPSSMQGQPLISVNMQGDSCSPRLQLHPALVFFIALACLTSFVVAFECVRRRCAKTAAPQKDRKFGFYRRMDDADQDTIASHEL